MAHSEWEVKFYQRPDGQYPVKDFLDDLSHEETERMLRQFRRLEQWGDEIRRPDSGYLRDKINELRAQWRRVQLRVLYFRDGNKFLLTNGVRGKQDKVPESAINRAIDYRTEYFAQKGES